jgi:hypothetical protein
VRSGEEMERIRGKKNNETNDDRTRIKKRIRRKVKNKKEEVRRWR